MILDANGKSMLTEPKARMVEDVKSFSYRLNLKNPDGSPAYESADFFQSRKYRCRPEDEQDAAREAFDWCVGQVTEDIRVFSERRAKRQAARAQRSAA
jgi:hypothetical protein